MHSQAIFLTIHFKNHSLSGMSTWFVVASLTSGYQTQTCVAYAPGQMCVMFCSPVPLVRPRHAVSGSGRTSWRKVSCPTGSPCLTQLLLTWKMSTAKNTASPLVCF